MMDGFISRTRAFFRGKGQEGVVREGGETAFHQTDFAVDHELIVEGSKPWDLLRSIVGAFAQRGILAT